MWYRATSATVTNGSTIVTINIGDDVALVQENSGLIFEGDSPVQVKRSYIDGGGVSIIELQRPWPYPTRSSQPLVIYPTDADFAAATTELRRVIDSLSVATLQEAEDGTDDEKIMSPSKVKAAIDFNTGTAASKDVGVAASNIPDKEILDTRLGTTGNLGTTATRDVGTASGNVMEVGAFGLGNATFYDTSQDFNNFKTSGQYAFTALSNANSPTINRYFLEVISYTNGQVVQTATSIIATNMKEIYTRWFDSVGTWTPWVRTYHTGNILGTVSQSGGAPTGAIIESGSNANGSYTKFADGILIMNATVPFDFSNLDSEVYSYPSTPVDTNNVYCSISFINTAIPARHAVYAGTSVMGSNGWRVANTSTTAETLSIFLTAIGRWY